VAADYGAPTSRRRLFLVARRDQEAITWPEPSHGPGRALPWRTAAECIDWSIPCPSVFERSRPLAEATQRRIAEGIRRYVLQSPRPFLVRYHGERRDGETGRVADLLDPIPTVTTENRFGLVAAFLAHHRSRSIGRPMDKPTPTVTGHGHDALAAVHLVHHRGESVGRSVADPMPTVTSSGMGHLGVAACFLDKLHGSARAGQPLDQPAPTVAAGGGRGGGHAALVAAFLARYYGSGGQWSACDEPLPTVVSHDRFALVTVTIDGEPYVLADIGMRMLQPRELARAQGFPDSYVLTGSKSAQVARIGNSVPPAVVAAIVRAQFNTEPLRRAA
jgi:DNA (cytosine-5)-methyltransferase 1